MNPLRWSTSTVVIVAALTAAGVAALVYVRAKQVGPSRSLFSGKLRAGAGAAVVVPGVVDITHARGRL